MTYPSIQTRSKFKAWRFPAVSSPLYLLHISFTALNNTCGWPHADGYVSNHTWRQPWTSWLFNEQQRERAVEESAAPNKHSTENNLSPSSCSHLFTLQPRSDHTTLTRESRRCTTKHLHTTFKSLCIRFWVFEGKTVTHNITAPVDKSRIQRLKGFAHQ